MENWENKIKAKLEQFEATPDTKVWENILQNSTSQASKNRIAFRSIAAAILLFAIVSASFLFFPATRKNYLEGKLSRYTPFTYDALRRPHAAPPTPQETQKDSPERKEPRHHQVPDKQIITIAQHRADPKVTSSATSLIQLTSIATSPVEVRTETPEPILRTQISTEEKSPPSQTIPSEPPAPTAKPQALSLLALGINQIPGAEANYEEQKLSSSNVSRKLFSAKIGFLKIKHIRNK